MSFTVDYSNDEPFLLLVVAVCTPTCLHCTRFLQNLEQAAQYIFTYCQERQHDTTFSKPPPLVAKLDATLMDAEMLNEKMGVTLFPSLLMVKPRGDEAMSHEWYGPSETREDLQDTILHYWYRWHYKRDATKYTTVIALSNMQALDQFLATHAAAAIRHLPAALNPNMSPEGQSHVEWLLSDDEENEQDPLVLFVQCGGDENAAEEQYDKMSRVMEAKRNVLFFQLQTCARLVNEVSNEAVIAFLVSPTLSDWSKWRDYVVKTQVLQPNESMEQFVVRMTTPTVMWYERQSVAPIAFPTYRKIHAVLFVDVDEYAPSQTAIRLFRQSCRWSKLTQDEDIVCLIVPQTERRILTTFGIDLWTPLDIQATQGGPVKPVLPTLLITDQRYEGMRRYYLDATEIMTSVTAMHEFVDKFWKNELTPALQSSDREERTNDSGVQVLTGATFREAVLNVKDKHTLLYLFAPTCGHCKRFSILWNELSRLVRHMGWDSLIDVAKMDVTANEIMFDDFTLDVNLVPDVYFFPRGDKTNPIRYNVIDEFGDGVGRLNDSLDIVEWLLDVAADDDLLNEAALLALLEEQDKKEDAKATASATSKQDAKESEV